MLPVLCLLFAVGQAQFDINTESITMRNYVGATKDWSYFPTGMWGSGPDRMNSFACKDQLITTWTAVTGTQPNPKHPTKSIEKNTGRVTQFSTASQGAGNKTRVVADKRFKWCNRMGGVVASDDCSIIAVICRSNLEPAQVPFPVKDFQQETCKKLDGCPFGWDVPSTLDPNDKNYRIVDKAYLLEFQDTIKSTPQVTRLVTALGGWWYGSESIALNEDNSIYMIDLKTTIGGNGKSYHEGAVNFAMKRSDKTYIGRLSSGWACGTGHVYSNRLTFNKELNVMGRYCSTDFNYKEETQWQDTWGTFFGTIKYKSGPADQVAQIGGFRKPTGGTYWAPRGGPLNMVSLGTNGFMGVTTDLKTIGLINLQGNSSSHHGKTYPSDTDWLDLGGKDEDKVAYMNLQKFGVRGRFLLGWADQVDGHKPGRFHVVEIDSDHRFHGEIMTFDTTSWHQDMAWTYIPSTGCVAWPNAWNDGDATWSQAYGQRRSFPTSFSSKLRITTVCPKQ